VLETERGIGQLPQTGPELEFFALFYSNSPGLYAPAPLWLKPTPPYHIRVGCRAGRSV